MSIELELVLVGFGNVARRFAALVDERRAILARDYGFTPRVIAIATRRHGCLHVPRGLDAAAMAARAARGERLAPLTGDTTAAFLRAVLATRTSARATRQGRLVVVETTTLDIARGEPATSHVRLALAAGAHVVTANKGPVAFAWHTLAAAARRAGRRFLFEGAVMDGIPVFNLVRETLPAVRVLGFRGVVNSTTNFILTSMERGEPFEQALAAMQAAGIAEADASLDVDGWDAAAKAAALANVLLGARITPRQVEREGLTGATAARAVAARAEGRRLKLVAAAERTPDGVRARVGLDALPADDLLAGLEGQQNAVVLRTDLLGEIAVVQRGSGLTGTAYALLSDLVTVSRDVTTRGTIRRSRP